MRFRLLILAFLLTTGKVCAETSIEALSCIKEQEQIQIAARSQIVLSPEIENAIKHGVKIKFIYQLRYKNKVLSVP